VDHILPKGGVHVSRAGFITFDPYELEADHFAAGLLMPEAPFKRAIDQYDPGLSKPWLISVRPPGPPQRSASLS
jgi:hypothetical protein